MSDWQVYTLLARMLGGVNLNHWLEQANQSDCWPDLLTLSSHQMVTTQLYWRLKSNKSAWEKIDSESQSYLQEIFELNGQRNAQLIDETRGVIAALNKHGIKPMLLKGTGLLFSREQPDIAYRMQLDIDFLAHPDDLEKAASIIEQMGYRYTEEISGSLEPVQDSRLNRILKIYEHHKHLPPFIHPGKRVIVELHRHPFSSRFQKIFRVSDLFDRAISKNREGLSWYEMSGYDQMHLLLTEGYIDAGYKRSLQLPLRLGCDYLDLLRLDFSDQLTTYESTIPDELSSAQQFPKQLIKELFIASTPDNQNIAVNKHLGWMKKSMTNNLLFRIINSYSDTVRKVINVVHNPGLIRRLF